MDGASTMSGGGERWGPPPGRQRRLRGLLRSLLDPLTYVQAIRLLHFYAYAHVQPRRRLTRGPGTRIAPNVSLRNGERITLGASTLLSERAYVWAGDAHGRVTIGENTMISPEVFITASNYLHVPGVPMLYQERDEQDVVIGDGVWLGARVFVGPGVTIGDGCVVAAGSVVTRSLPPMSIAAGVPARVVGRRDSAAAGIETESAGRATAATGEDAPAG
jgi:acetyltransferase-like isoleucine patch superfamily enzyme